MKKSYILTILLLAVLFLIACGGTPTPDVEATAQAALAATQTAQPTNTLVPPTDTPIPPTATPTATATFTPTPTNTSTATPTPTPTPHPAVERVRAFREATNAIEPGKESPGGSVSVALDEVIEMFTSHTTLKSLPLQLMTSPLVMSMALGQVDFEEMTYELLSESETCAVVKDSGFIVIGSERIPTESETIVVKQEDEWLIDLRKESCP